MLGVGISELTFDAAMELFLNAAATKRKVRANFATVNTMVRARQDASVREQIKSSQVVAPDGMPLVWLGRLRGRKVERVCGPDTMPALCERSQGFGYRHFFYGGAEGVAERLAANLQARFPKMQVAGTYTPPFRPLTPEEKADVVSAINSAKPEFVWVCLNTPRQDAWVAEYQELLDAPVLLAVGAAFDFHSGGLARAPRWMQRAGLEWVFRLVKEPRRLWRRYLIDNVLFAIYLAGDVVRPK